MNVPNTIEQNGERVLTTAQLAEAYGTSEKRIQENFRMNKSRYQEGKHFYHVTGDELKKILDTPNFGGTKAKKIRQLYIWTERGALLHAKSLNTDKAWEVYDFLVEHYFRAVTMDGLMDLAADTMMENSKANKEEQTRKQFGELHKYYRLACNAHLAQAQAELEQIRLMAYLEQYPQFAELVNIPMLASKGGEHHD